MNTDTDIPTNKCNGTTLLPRGTNNYDSFTFKIAVVTNSYYGAVKSKNGNKTEIVKLLLLATELNNVATQNK
jgi:hypothetical protein